jgi:hypothetical protein
MFRRAVVAIVAPLAFSACAPWHMFSGGSPCKTAIERRRVTVGSTTVPIARGADDAIQIGQVDVSADLAQNASDVVQQFDQLQLSTCQTMQSQKQADRAPYASLRVQILADFAFVIKGLGRATTPVEYAGALTDARARLVSDTGAAAQLGRP